ncbi:hypothetical protein PWT90_00213 [Aphanocladium album]|nr:hypothetical protein PWT90_00213 [Aphanocladium album]
MMPRFQLWAALALLGLNIATVIADGSCVQGCVKDTLPRFSEFNCVKDQNGCLCGSQAFIDAVAGCSKPCNPTQDEFRQVLFAPPPDGGICFSLDPAKVPNAKDIASQSSVPASTSTPASTAPPSTSSTPSASPTSTLTPASTSTTLATSTTSGTPTTSSASSTGSTTSSHTSTTTSVAAGETSAAATPVPASGISSGAAAGIGIGVAIVVVAVAVIAFCLLKKRKGQAAPRHSMEISKPLPGSGRTYPARDRDRDSFDKYGNDIEMTSNRYEDMVPSQQPRTMV